MNGAADVTELLPAAAAGDADAWEALVEEYGTMVWAVARSFGLDESTAGDVSQTVWLRLQEHIGAIREPRALPGWLSTTAKREALRVLRRRRREVYHERDIPVEDPTRAVDDADEAADRRSRVGHALHRLSEACRQLLRLLTVEPALSYDEIASLLGRPRGSLGPTRARCLDHLRRELAAMT